MGRRKKLNREELLARKRAAEQARRDKIKLNPEAYAQYKEKEKQRYQKRKEEKKLVQINDMTPRQKRNQRKKWKINSKNFRDRKRHQLHLMQRLGENTPPDTDSDDIDAVPVGVIEKPPHTSPSASHSRPVTRSVGAVTPTELDMSVTSAQCDSPKGEVLSTLKRKLRYNVSKKLLWYKKQLDDLRKRNEMLRKRIFREKIKKRHSDSPKTKVEMLLSDPNKKADVKKTLVFAETIKNNLTTNYENLKTHEQKRQFKENIEPACKTLKKYKILRDLKPKMVRQVKSKNNLINKKNKIQEDIKIFFESDNNSRIAAGKKDCITRKKEKKQKRFLEDSLINLHKKFLETHNYAVSYSFFCKCKPFWIVTPVEKDKETCMCKLHENVTLLAQALWKNKIIKEKSASEILSVTVCNIHNLTCLERKCPVCINKVPTIMEFDNSIEIRYFIWEAGTKEINTKNGTKQIKITIKKQKRAYPKALLEILMSNLQKFYIHCANITNQFKSTTTLKTQLKRNEAVIHMDFSENYSTKYNTEIQSLHFGGSRTQISLHTSVLYIPGKEPQSFCTYSDCLRHDAIAVWGHIVPILKFIENVALGIDTLHFITDSTCSQYRNKTINYIITKLHYHFENLQYVTWNYTESGHGKGAPDGVGATLKRTADQLVRYGKDIPDINTFADEMKKAVKNIILEYISEYDIYEKEYFLPSLKALKPFRGMMKVHQIVWNKDQESTIVMRRQSCFSELCKNNAVICTHGKHLGFYELPMLSSSQENRSEKSPLNLPSDVVPLHRCQNFIATGSFDLPFELQDTDTDYNKNILELIMNADSPPSVQGIENPFERSDVISQEELIPEVTENPKSPSILIQDSALTQDIPLSTKEEKFKVGSWVIISYLVKKNTKYFIGQIINTNDDGTFIVKFLRKLKGTTDVFTWPENEDEDCVSKDSIIKMLDEPNINRRGQLMFSEIQDYVIE